MKLKQLFTEDDAVSPVIGVILMVAITVILAAVIGAFVLGLGGDQTATPQVTWDTNENNNQTVFTHNGGDTIDTDVDSLTATLNGNSADYQNSDRITAGSSLEVGNESSRSDFGSSGLGSSGDWVNGNTVRIVWSPSGSDDTNVIGDYQLSDQ